MLVLSRKLGERVVVPELGLSLTVLSIEGKQVRLGIAASQQIKLYREEAWRRSQQEARRRRCEG
jgi:carbon storage regulator